MKKTLLSSLASGLWLVSTAMASPQTSGTPEPSAMQPRVIGRIAPLAGAKQQRTGAVTIPADAAKVDEQHYRAKDADGVEWVYTKTPFGINKGRADEAEAKLPARTVAPVKASVHGDQVRFERRTPFGVNAWTKELSDLTPEEKTLVTSTATESKAPESTTAAK